MRHRGVNRLPVLDEERRVVGIVTGDDVVAAVARVVQSPDEPTTALGRPRIAPD
jgi:CBS domain-containing protein